MAPRNINFDTVRKIGLTLPHVEEGTTYGSPALKLRGQMLACMAVHKSAEPHSLIVRVGFDERAQLIAADPRTYYLTSHYVNYPVVLARLSRIHPDALRDLLAASWRFVDASAGRRKRRGIRRRGTEVSRYGRGGPPTRN